LALDEPQDGDTTFHQDGLTFLIDQKLLERYGGIKVDFIEAGYRSGFSITSTRPIGSQGGSCSYGGDSDACGGSCG
jgi:iron-sulfur cluster assembly protein